MILTVTMNPSVDIFYQLDSLIIDDINRIETPIKTAGGKGLNVTRVISQFGEKVKATGIIGGTLGDYILKNLEKEGIASDFLKIEQESRNCIAIIHEGKQTEILEAGPLLDEQTGLRFKEKFINLLDTVSLITISGSLPRGIKSNFYHQLIIESNKKNIPVLLDTSGTMLKEALESEIKPFLIKPNLKELSQLLCKDIPTSLVDLKQALSSRIFDGIKWIVVSMGAEGAFAKYQSKYFLAKVPRINAVNPVGSGDATVAGLAVAIHQGKTPEEILKTAMTAGILNTLEEKTGYININKFHYYYDKIEITEIN